MIDSNNNVLRKINDVDPTGLNKMLNEEKIEFRKEWEKDKAVYLDKIADILAKNEFMIFIKGTPQKAKCKFSRKLVESLNALNLQYSSMDIMSDLKLKGWLKFYSKWKTYPQIYIKGKIIGGLDVTLDLIKQGKFLPMVPEEFK